jgi:hypothetical protein
MSSEGFGGQPATAAHPSEDRQHHSVDTAEYQTFDPICALIARLDAAAASGGPITLDGREPIRVRAIAGGFAIGRRP